jgi:hypothetical protein
MLNAPRRSARASAASSARGTSSKAVSDAFGISGGMMESTTAAWVTSSTRARTPRLGGHDTQIETRDPGGVDEEMPSMSGRAIAYETRLAFPPASPRGDTAGATSSGFGAGCRAASASRWKPAAPTPSASAIAVIPRDRRRTGFALLPGLVALDLLVP